MAQHYVYRFHAKLLDYEPAIWRTFEIDGNKTMAQLGYIVMIMFEMQASHLFYLEGDEIILTYDFGDNWQVILKLEDMTKKEVSLKGLPRVLDGAGFGILEDVGGTYGLEKIAKILKSKTAVKHDEWLMSLKENNFDLEAFNIEEMNQRLKKLLRIYKNIYEYNISPNQKTLDFLLRS